MNQKEFLYFCIILVGPIFFESYPRNKMKKIMVCEKCNGNEFDTHVETQATIYFVIYSSITFQLKMLRNTYSNFLSWVINKKELYI